MLNKLRRYNGSCITILFKWFSALKHVYHIDIFCYFNKFGMYDLVYMLTYSS